MEGLVFSVLIFTGICVAIAIKLGAYPAIRRWWGALRIHKLLELELPGSHYAILQDITLASHKDSVQIDHLVISAYGIFVIKHIDFGGQVSGKPGDAYWTRTTRRREQRFRNPLFACVEEVNALKSLLGLDASMFQFVLVFSSNVTFNNPMPTNVTKLDGLPLFIEGRDRLVLDFDEIPRLAGQVRREKSTARGPGINFLPAAR